MYDVYVCMALMYDTDVWLWRGNEILDQIHIKHTSAESKEGQESGFLWRKSEKELWRGKEGRMRKKKREREREREKEEKEDEDQSTRKR